MDSVWADCVNCNSGGTVVTYQLQTCNNQPNILHSYIETATFDQQRNLQANG